MDELQKDQQSRPYKFKELKVYSSTEWLAENKKKYRQVFDRYDTSYIYAELSFYNKNFDEEVWEVDVSLKCYAIRKSKKQVCELNFKRKVSKYDNVVYIREGWGNKKDGAFWKRGAYYWEAWIRDEKVATKYFYIEEPENEFDGDENAYLKLKSFKLYEGQYDDVNESDRKYYINFSAEDTRYIYSEIALENQVLSRDWQCELFIKFYNEARELKGQVVRLIHVQKGDEEVKVTAGWGSNVKGSWRYGSYTVELVFMDHLLGVVPFDVLDEFEEGVPAVHLPNQTAPVILEPEEDQNLSFDDLMVKLDALIGLDEIKKKVREHAKYIQFLQLRKAKGFEESEEINVHSVFIGNPGTGKTTVAKMMGKLYKKMGLLTKGHVHEVDRVDLVGEYIGQTAPKVKEAIEKARGGVLFIDEAYALARSNDDSKDFGREVIEILVKEMSNGKGDLAVIAAGYPKEMKYFLDSNPGLKSRFKLKFEFDDYLPQELSEIADFACGKKEIVLTPEAKAQIDEIITEAFRNRDRSFGNARFVHDILDKAKLNLGLRIMSTEDPNVHDSKMLSTITLDDVKDIDWKRPKKIPNIPVDEDLLKTSLEELNRMIGIEGVKEQINELVRLVKYYQLGGHNVLNRFFLHTVFVGNPGTGKNNGGSDIDPCI